MSMIIAQLLEYFGEHFFMPDLFSIDQLREFFGSFILHGSLYESIQKLKEFIKVLEPIPSVKPRIVEQWRKLLAEFEDEQAEFEKDLIADREVVLDEDTRQEIRTEINKAREVYRERVAKKKELGAYDDECKLFEIIDDHFHDIITDPELQFEKYSDEEFLKDMTLYNRHSALILMFNGYRRNKIAASFY